MLHYLILRYFNDAVVVVPLSNVALFEAVPFDVALFNVTLFTVALCNLHYVNVPVFDVAL